MNDKFQAGLITFNGSALLLIGVSLPDSTPLDAFAAVAAMVCGSLLLGIGFGMFAYANTQRSLKETTARRVEAVRQEKIRALRPDRQDNNHE